MPTFLLKKNNAKSRLATSLTAGATTLTVKSASPFPPTGNFMITIWDRQNYSDPGDDNTMEILKVTGVSGNTFTVQRGQESTIARAHPNYQYVEHLITAYQITELENEINLLHTLISGENNWDRNSGSDTIVPVIDNSNLDIGTGVVKSGNFIIDAYTVSRTNGIVSSVVAGGKTYTITRGNNNAITLITDGSSTWTYTRNSNNKVTAKSVA